MKGRFSKIIVCFMIATLLGGAMIEFSHASETRDCQCCKGSCHGAAKACVCSHQVIQPALPERDDLTVPDIMSYFAQNSYVTYKYLSVRDIFHPPKISLVFV